VIKPGTKDSLQLHQLHSPFTSMEVPHALNLGVEEDRVLYGSLLCLTVMKKNNNNEIGVFAGYESGHVVFYNKTNRPKIIQVSDVPSKMVIFWNLYSITYYNFYSFFYGSSPRNATIDCWWPFFASLCDRMEGRRRFLIEMLSLYYATFIG
jgi:hypothetical protein